VGRFFTTKTQMAQGFLKKLKKKRNFEFSLCSLCLGGE
jgi:hypothetical protein